MSNLSQIEKISLQNQIDTELLLQNDRIGQASKKNLLSNGLQSGYVSGLNSSGQFESGINKPDIYTFSRPNQKIIDEYVKSNYQPFEYGIENGIQKKIFKYKIPQDEPSLEQVPQEYTEAQYNADVVATNNDIRQTQRFIDDEEAALKFFKKKIKKINNDPTNYLFNFDETTETINKLNQEIEDTKHNLQYLYQQQTNYQNQIYILEKKYNQEKAERNKIIQRNDEKIENYKDALNLLNRNAFDINKDPLETQEAYLNRLKNNAQLETTEMLFEDASYKTLQEFKEKMKELIKNIVTIEQVCNSFSIIEKNELLKRWPSVKKSFLERFGENNTRLGVNDINEFLKTTLTETETNNLIKEFAKQGLSDLEKNKARYVDIDDMRSSKKNKSKIESIKPFSNQIISDEIESNNPISDQIISFPEDDTVEIELNPPAQIPERILDNIQGGFFTENDIRTGLFIRNITRGTEVILKMYNGSSATTHKYYIMYSFTGKPGTFKEIPVGGNRFTTQDRVRVFNIIQNQTGITKQDIINWFRLEKFDINVLYNFFINNDIVIPDLYSSGLIKYVFRKGDDAANHSSTYIGAETYGHGIQQENLPKLVQFGKLKINLKKLKYDNILSLKNANGTSIGGLPNMKISERFSKILLNMLKGIHPHRDDLTSLHSNEKQVYDRILVMAGLHKTIVNDHAETLSDIKKRINLLMGEIEIGNDSPLIKTELKQLAQTAYSMKGITLKEYNKFIDQFE